MSLDREQRIAYAFAGTVALPSPFPASGQVRLIWYPSETGKTTQIFLKVFHSIGPRLRIARLVKLEDVRAIRYRGPLPPAQSRDPKPKQKAKNEEQATAQEQGEWSQLTSEELQAIVTQQISALTADSGDIILLTNAILYVGETAPVLMQVDVGMTAGESAEYYPPMPRGARGRFCEGDERGGDRGEFCEHHDR